jgi:hypothetical protein
LTDYLDPEKLLTKEERSRYEFLTNMKTYYEGAIAEMVELMEKRSIEEDKKWSLGRRAGSTPSTGPGSGERT